MDLPIFEVCAVIHEVDLFSEWLPFCSDAKTVKKIKHGELIPYVNIHIYLIIRFL